MRKRKPKQEHQQQLLKLVTKTYVTISEAQQILGMSRGTIDRLLRDGELQRVQLGNAISWRIPMKSIERFVAKLSGTRT